MASAWWFQGSALFVIRIRAHGIAGHAHPVVARALWHAAKVRLACPAMSGTGTRVFHVKHSDVDDRVFWGGKPENPQPPPRPVSWWVPTLITLALGAAALGVAFVLTPSPP